VRLNPYKEETKKVPAPPAAIFLLPLLMLTMSSCAWFNKTETTAVECTKQVVKDNAVNLIPVIADIFEHGQSVEADLNAIAKALGADGLLIVACVTEQLYHDWTTKPAATPDRARGIANAKEWLAKHAPKGAK
jgi:hypothetical protein